jgi:septal ring factor EnvC (AmiA/AmiB activator)
VDRPSNLPVSVVLSLLAVLSGLHAASITELEDRIGEERQELSRMRAELAEGRRRLRELADKAKDKEAELSQVESNVQLGARLLSSIDSTEALYKELVAKSQIEVRKASSTWMERRHLLAVRIRQMYVRGRPSPQVSWIGKSDPSEWGRTLADFRSVVKADRTLLELVKVREAAARKELRSHKIRVEGLEEVSYQKRQDLAQLEEERQSKAGALLELRSKEQAERNRLAALEASQKCWKNCWATWNNAAKKPKKSAGRAEAEAKKRDEEIKRREEEHRREALKRKKEGKPPPPPPKILPPPPPPPPKADKALAGPPPAKKGLCWPVQGSIVSRFGLEKNPVLGTVTRNLGIEIAGKPDQKVVSAASGRVAAVTELPGRGNTVILEHPGGYFSIYGQLGQSKVSVGEAVAACAEVGRLAAEPGRVYFEYRHNLKAEDPQEWLTR